MGLTRDKSTHFVSFEVDESMIKRVDPQDASKRLYIEEDINLRTDKNKARADLQAGKTC